MTEQDLIHNLLEDAEKIRRIRNELLRELAEIENQYLIKKAERIVNADSGLFKK